MSDEASAGTASVLRRWQRSVYGLPYLGYSIATLPVAAFIPAFYASERGLELAAVGALLALTRLSDVVTDPLIGWLSDRLRTPIGRRKPVILAGLPLLCLSAWMLFVPPQDAGAAHVFVWSALLYLGFTLVDLPFKAFGAELSPQYDERAELAGWREGFGLLGTALGLVAVFALTREGEGSLGEQLYVLALIAVCATPLLFLLTLTALREPRPPGQASRDLSFGAKFRVIWRNGPYRRLLFVSLVLVASGFGAAALTALILDQMFGEAQLFPVLLLAELIAMVAAIPFWLWLARRTSKHMSVAIAAGWGGLISLLMPLIAQSSFELFFVLAVLKAISLGAITVLLNGIAADVVDLDAARTGEERTGIYFAFWGMVNKGAVALGVLAATNMPALFGYSASAQGVTNAGVLLWVYGLAPALGLLLCIPVLWNWPLTRKRQERLRSLIDRRNARIVQFGAAP
ncbi:MFS transporter [Erythrobacter sp.]|jgi:Na+/melibiose symporter-like transporter|uniref:MFS transporter n=1 Tax=Erythrobacter sp. TaxID=1042 RepID=UPI002EC3EC72|nr:MFS transporter [Erythrobacter sp.]